MGKFEWLMEWKGKTLWDLWESACARHGESEFVVDRNQRVSYLEMHALVNSFARGLIELGIKKGDKVAIWMPNCLDWALAEFSVIAIGGVMVPLSTRFRSYDVEYILKQSDSAALIMSDSLGKIDFYRIICEVCPEIEHSEPGDLRSEKLPLLRHVIVPGDHARPGCLSTRQVIDRGERIAPGELQERRSEILPQDVVNIPYTSGTTGFPKGVMTSHEQYLGQTVCFRQRLGMREKDRFIAIAPFFANFGNYFGILLPTMVGGCSIMIGAYNPALALKLIENERATHFSGTPTMYLDLLNHPDFDRSRVSSLRTAMTGAAPAPVQMVKDVYSKMGVEVICNGYGMTENSGCTTMTARGDDPEVLAETTGHPLPGVSICIKDPATGETLKPREVGELCTRGWIVMKGYYKMEEQTKKCFDEQGWFHTGDLGMLDEEGHFIITGRLKDMFISGGFNVYPAEVENFLYTLQGVVQVAIVGFPDERMGEVGMAFVVPKAGCSLTEEDVLSYCKGHIAGYKVPRHVVFVDEMPMAGVGKIQKFVLCERGMEELQKRRVKG